MFIKIIITKWIYDLYRERLDKENVDNTVIAMLNEQLVGTSNLNLWRILFDCFVKQ